MTKFILLALIVSLPSFAQNTDELTLESTTAPTIIEDGTDLSSAPAEEPLEAPDTVDVTENVETVNPAKDIPAQLPDTAPMELTDKPVETAPIAEPADDMTTEMADTAPAEIETPNPIAEDKKPEDKPEEVAVEDRAPSPQVSTPVITSEMPTDDRYLKHRASHWLTTFNFEGMKYELPFDFEGARKNIRTRDQELYGGRLGFGGQLHIGKGLFTTSMAEVFYNGTLFTKSQNAGPDDEDEEAGNIKRTSGFYGVDLSQSLGYIFEFRTKNPFMDEWAYLTFEPFVEAGLGVAKSYNKVRYNYDTGTVGAGVQENYKRTIRDDLTNARIGAGFNLTGRSGFFLQARVTINRYDVTERKIDTYRKQDDVAGVKDPSVTDKDVKIDPVTMFTLGGGYKF
ncbi:MAG: hypothetical protein V4598_12140 [Bdellovibrionota bacterium]